MKQILASIMLSFITIAVSAQLMPERKDCVFLNNLIFKNGRDTFWVRVVKIASVKPAPTNFKESILGNLGRQKKLNIKDFLGYAAIIRPVGCSRQYNVPCSDHSDFAFNLNTNVQETEVLARCVVFEGLFEFDKPFFIIDKIVPIQ